MSTSQINTEVSSRENSWIEKVGNAYSESRNELLLELKNKAPRETVKVLGFPVEISDTEFSEELKRKLVAEIEEENKIRKDLEAKGFKPQAIVPKKFWESLIAQSETLYSFFRITPEGKVYGDGRRLWEIKDLANFSNLPKIEKFDMFYYPFFLFLLAISSLKEETRTFGISMQIVLILAFVVKYLHLFVPYIKWAKQKIRGENINYKKILFPHRKDRGGDLFDIVLPTPPEHFKRTLALCHKHGIKTFLVTDQRAFHIKIDNRKLKELDTKYEPMVCTEIDSMVVVLDQFGDYPEEKRAIELAGEYFRPVMASLLPLQEN